MNVVGGIVISLIKLGEYQKAYDIVRPYIDLLSDNVDVNLAYAGISKKMGCEKNALQCLERLIEKIDFTNDQYIQLYFSADELNTIPELSSHGRCT